MWLPLAILGTLALVAGLLNAHLLHLHLFDEWLEPVFKTASAGVKTNEELPEMPFLAGALAAFAIGVGGAYWVYVTQKGAPARSFVEGSPGLYALVRDKWRIDELYEETFIGAVDSLAEISVWVDKWIVDGIVARATAFLVSISGSVLRFSQTGHVQAYAFTMVLGLGGIGWFFVAPHAEYRLKSDEANGKYSLSLTPGAGYTYRWDETGDGKWDGGFGDKRELNFALAPDKTQKVRFQVKNGFGRVKNGELAVHRPLPDKSGADPNGMEVTPEMKAAIEKMGGKVVEPNKPAPRRPQQPGLLPVPSGQVAP
jgi:NADH-quinone oxidoreductase subunit L